jgi:hypothetical protein
MVETGAEPTEAGHRDSKIEDHRDQIAEGTTTR